MTSDERVRRIQRLYPLLYFACHHDHRRRDRLTERNLRILHHLSAAEDVHASGLARHLGVSRSTMSEALAQLERLGLIRRDGQRDGSPGKRLALTAAGTAAIASDDGLDGEAVGAILAELGESEQDKVVEGLELIATAIERRER